MTLTDEDVKAIAAEVARLLGTAGPDSIKADAACKILGIGRRSLSALARRYPELQPGGRGTQTFSRAACLRVARLRSA